MYEKTINLLEVFLQSQDSEMELSALAKLSGLNISTAHRIASTLCKKGYLRQQQRKGKYSLGYKFLEYAKVINKQTKIVDSAYPFMEKLNKIIDESVNLAILDSNEVIYVGHIPSTHPLRTFTEIGNRVPLHCTGVGKVFLADMSDSNLKAFYDKNGLPRYTKNTLTDMNKLKKELITIKKHGVAQDNEEMESGVSCVAAAIKDYTGEVIAALSISLPSIRLRDKTVKELKPLVKSWALEISKVLGYSGE